MSVPKALLTPVASYVPPPCGISPSSRHSAAGLHAPLEEDTQKLKHYKQSYPTHSMLMHIRYCQITKHTAGQYRYSVKVALMAFVAFSVSLGLELIS